MFRCQYVGKGYTHGSWKATGQLCPSGMESMDTGPWSSDRAKEVRAFSTLNEKPMQSSKERVCGLHQALREAYKVPPATLGCPQPHDGPQAWALQLESHGLAWGGGGTHRTYTHTFEDLDEIDHFQ